jgi:D-3-phosphoglycerate dehydrogenase
VLIVDTLHDSIHPLLKEIGVQANYQPDWKRAEILAHIAAYEGIIVRSKLALDAAFFDAATRLRWVGRAGSGLDLIDTTIAQERNIKIVNAPEGNRDAVAEHTMGLLLTLLHKIAQANTQIKNHTWLREAHRGIELLGKTVAIIGYGNVGRAFAQRLSGFGCRVLAYDKHKFGFSGAYVQEATMEYIFATADIVSLHIPLTASTNHLVDEAYLSKFKKNILLLNTARGEIVNLTALQKALQTGKVWGAGLDVLENERLDTLTTPQQAAFEYLCEAPQVILTPHIAGWTHESYRRINEVLTEKIKSIL